MVNWVILVWQVLFNAFNICMFVSMGISLWHSAYPFTRTMLKDKISSICA
ncbi:hypothetical protein OIU84_015117 [Salix udensis]|uniref:Uncharacterized protein n=1 Tax=Salix udensis TaxID=889485 RepID=A0AAD6JDK6_9ROSI|nr:hypothetical protein OIU84_015117 [Salix udensis]